jgi:hypothetical protein
MLLVRIPAAHTKNHIVALRREDYPKIRFWTRQDWNSAAQVPVLEVDEEGEVFPELDEEEEGSKEPSPSPGPACARGRHRAAKGINVTMKYIELEDGTVIDGYRAAEIRRYAQYFSLPHLFLPDSRTPVGFLLDSYWTPGLQVDSYWIPTGLLDSSWIPTGFLLDSYWTFSPIGVQ